MTSESDLRTAVGFARRCWARQFGIVALLMVLVVGVLVGAGWYLIQNFIFPATNDGQCFVLDRNQCVDVSREQIESAAGVVFPEGVEIVDSGASQSLKAGTTRALVALEGDTELILSEGYVSCMPESSCLPRYVSDYLSDRGLAVEKSLVDSTGSGSRSVVNYAVGDDGRRWALVRVVWDG